MPLYSAKRTRLAWMCVCVYSKTASGSLSTPAELPQFKWKMWTRRLRTERRSSAHQNQQCGPAKTGDEFRRWTNMLIGLNDADSHVKPDLPVELIISLFCTCTDKKGWDRQKYRQADRQVCGRADRYPESQSDGYFKELEANCLQTVLHSTLA